MHVIKLSDKTKSEVRKINENFSVREVKTLGYVFEDGEHIGTERMMFSVPEDFPLPTKPGYYSLSFAPRKSQYGQLEASRSLQLEYLPDFKTPAQLT